MFDELVSNVTNVSVFTDSIKSWVSGLSINTVIVFVMMIFMIARAAKLCGMQTEYDTATSRDVLAQFGDYTKCSTWAWPSLAFCYDKRILDSSDLNVRPGDAILRCEVSQMVYNLLSQSNLL